MLTRKHELVSMAAFTGYVINATTQLLAEFPKEKLIFVYRNNGDFYKSVVAIPEYLMGESAYTTVTYFSHKIADFVSTLDFFTEG